MKKLTKISLVLGFLLLVNVSLQANDKVKNKASIYPNPVTDVQMTISAEKEINSVEILNILGQKVQQFTDFSDTKVKVDLDQTQNGVYLVKVVYSDRTEYVERIYVK